VTVTGKMDNHTAFSAMTPDDAFLLHAFAGITASASATIAGGVYGGFATPDIDLGFTTIDIPDITFDAGFSATIPLPSIAPITISDGQFTKPDGATGAIDVNIKTGDAPVTLNLDEDGIGHITIGPPTGINLSDFDVTNVQPSGLGTLHIGGVSTPFLGASLDLDALAIHAVPELEPLFHDVLNYDFGGFQVGGKLDSDFALTGDLSFREDAYFTPQIFCDFTTSFGETLTHVDASTPTGFTTPEGEGTFTVNGSYTSEADFTTVISLVANIHFDFTLLKASLFAHVGEGPIGFDLLGLDLPAAYSGTLSMANLTIPIFSNTDHYVLGQTFSDTFVLAYEKFRTTFGSGDNFTMTTNQTFADGNQNANHLVGNLLSDTITGAGGGDTLEGLAGGDLLNGEDGDDTVIGGGGLDTLLGGAGDDLIIGGANGNSIDGGDGDDSITSGARADSILGGAGNDHISGGNGDNTIDGGDGNDTIFSGKGDDVITDLSGVVNITDTGGDNTFIFGDQGVTFTYLLGNTHITSGSGDDVLTTGGGSDNIRTGDGANVVNAGDGANVVIAGAGADQITTGGGADFIKAYGGADIVNAGDGANTVLGMDGSDSLTGGAGADYMDGGRGNDTLVGGDGNNSLYGEEGNDVLIAGAGADSLLGQYGRDRLFGGDGRDFISGGAAADTITGGLGADTLVGDAGNDRFVYHGVAESNGAAYDDLADFNVRMDALDLDVTVSAIGHTRSGDLALASFDLDLQHLLRGERLPVGQAVVVKASGELAGHVYLVVDANGLAGYQTGQDYVFELDPTASTHFTTADFI
jgi:Ca2+-binding RTX toxin-like protein